MRYNVNLLEIFGLGFIAMAVLNFIVGFFAVKTPLTLDQSEEKESIEKENLTEIYY
jgi:hypothetical protein